jgi:hypothetical protein
MSAAGCRSTPIAWNANQVAFTVSEPLHAPALSLILGLRRDGSLHRRDSRRRSHHLQMLIPIASLGFMLILFRG